MARSLSLHFISSSDANSRLPRQPQGAQGRYTEIYWQFRCSGVIRALSNPEVAARIDAAVDALRQRPPPTQRSGRCCCSRRRCYHIEAVRRGARAERRIQRCELERLYQRQRAGIDHATLLPPEATQQAARLRACTTTHRASGESRSRGHPAKPRSRTSPSEAGTPSRHLP